jgi:large subunit ribosomal protein L10
MPKTRIQKEETVTRLTDKLSRSKSVVFANYQGMTMTQLSELRKQLREQSAEFSITKNNLIKIALKNARLDIENSAIEGPTATLFSFEDEISPIKALTKSFKDSSIGSVKGGVLNGEYLDQYKVTKLASLPSKDELRAQAVGALGAPLYGIVSVLQANIRNLVYALDQIRVSRGGE